VPHMCSALQEVTAGIDPEVSVLTTDDIKRMAFEIVAFSTAVLMSQEVPKYSAQIKSWGFQGADADAIRAFNADLLTCLEDSLRDYGYFSVREKVVKVIDCQAETPDIQLELGKPLDLAQRLARYAGQETVVDYFKLLCRYLSYTADMSLFLPMRVVAEAFAPPILEVVRIVVDDVFNRDQQNPESNPQGPTE